MNNYSLQVRIYNKDGTFYTRVSSFMENISKSRAKFWWDVFFLEQTPEEKEKFTKTTACNVMVRKNGKLISYRELFHD